MVTDKMRVHILAKELNVPSKVIVEKCKAEGISTVKNHMSTLSAGLHATIREWFSDGQNDNAVETTQRVNLDKVRLKRTGTRRASTKKASAPSKPPAKAGPTERALPARTATAAQAPAGAIAIADAPAHSDGNAETLTLADEATVPAAEHEAVAAVTEPPVAGPPRAAEETPDVASDAAPPEPTQVMEPVSPTVEDSPVAEPSETGEEPAAPPAPKVVAPAGPQNVPGKAKLQGPRVVRYEAPDYDMLDRARRGAPAPVRDRVGPGTTPPAPGSPTEREAGKRKGRLSPRRGSGHVADRGQQTSGWRDRDLEERRERLAGATGRRIHRRRNVQDATGRGPGGLAERKTEATVHEPVRMKEFCSATGLNFMQCFGVLKSEHDILANVNMALPNETAELLALHFGIDLKVIADKTRLDELQEEFARRERKHCVRRPPVVAMLGHVDHGKTSLLDAIRATRVAASEDGGITQHIGASRIETDRGAVTFLDTPGHEAFTAMRARGADLTDVVVLVVAADDGLMPQTIEAINHAKAAEVPIVVALNKIDLGDHNRLKIYGQLSEHELTPSGDWGGETDVIDTSATTGAGIKELVEHLADLSSLLDLKADPTLPACGTVVESQTKPGVGAVMRILVQEGTLRVGDFVVCGPGYGKVRALVDDRGGRIREAGPAMPAEVWGLDDVPSAGDKLYVVPSLQRAKDIATETKQSRIENARVQSQKIQSLEEMFRRKDAAEVPELTLIIKADVDGSVAALRQALSKPFTDEVNLTIRHAGVGAVNDSDVLLAAACGGIIVAFRVEPSVGVRRLAEQHRVEIRNYRVIYDVCDDMKQALEGLLAPEERIESRAAAEVRQLFRLGRKGGVVAGAHVTSGVMDRGHLAKVIRDGVVVREGCRFASLRRFKDDAKEVRTGLDCGIRLESFDDIHVGDVIESYEIVKIARTL